MTAAEAAKIVAVLAAAYPNSRLPDATIALYESVILEMDSELVRQAVGRLVRTHKFLPTIAELLAAAADVSLGPARSALEAWGDVGKAIRRVGSYGLPRFADPIVAECVKFMGWRELCLGNTPEAVDRARFCELYADLQRKQREQDVSEPHRLLPPASAPQTPLPANVRELVQGMGGAGRNPPRAHSPEPVAPHAARANRPAAEPPPRGAPIASGSGRTSR